MEQYFLLTKVVATLGPASSSVEMITKLINAGATAFRINFSHGTFNEYDDLIKNIRDASRETGRYVAILGDLSGPKIRVGMVEDGGVKLTKEKQVIFRKGELLTEDNDDQIVFSTTYPHFIDEVMPGEPILLDDGNVSLKCTDVSGEGDDKHIICEVVNGGIITSKKGVNLPETQLSVSAITPKDKKCIKYAVENNFDCLALSFVRSGEDLRELKKILFDLGARPQDPISKTGIEPDMSMVEGNFYDFLPVISKIEKPQAIDNLDEILAETDMVMVARGDLGVEMDLAEVAVHQKEIVRKCRNNGVPVIVATQMLQSMIDEPVPTRAEVSDVANAIFDGADAVMLSGETAVGDFPLESVEMMRRIIIKSNRFLRKESFHFQPDPAISRMKNRSMALAKGVKSIVQELDADLIVVWSELGGSAIFLSEQRMNIPVVAISPNEKTLRLMGLIYGVLPYYMERPKSMDELFKKTFDSLLENNEIDESDPVIFVHRHPFDKVGLTNEITVKYLTDL